MVGVGAGDADGVDAAQVLQTREVRQGVRCSCVVVEAEGRKRMPAAGAFRRWMDRASRRGGLAGHAGARGHGPGHGAVGAGTGASGYDAPGGRCVVAVGKHTTRPGKFTYEDLRHTPADGSRYEVLEGELVVSPAPKVKHQVLVGALHEMLYRAQRTGCGRVLLAPMDVVLSAQDVVQPDLLFVAEDRLRIITEDNIQGPPDLVVEVISEGSRNRDAITKRGLYERHGVRFYWRVDPEEATVRVFALKDGAYGEPATLKAGQQVRCALFPDITQDVAQLFAAT